MARAMEKPVVTQRTTQRKQTVKRSARGGRKSLSQEERIRMIEEAAYFIAQERGFQPGDSLQDWLEAERQISEAGY